MGHMYPGALSELMIRRIYAWGTVTLQQLIEIAEKKEIGVSCAEGVYHERQMYERAFETVLAFHVQRHQVVPVLRNDEDREIWRIFETDGWDASEAWEPASPDNEKFLSFFHLGLRFAPGARRLYQQGDIDHLTSLTE